MDTKKLISFEEYSKIKHKTPYFYTVKSNNQKLYYFGERHSHNPQDSQWIQAKKFWLEFIKNTDGQKRIAFVEAGRPSAEEAEEKAIIKAGGTGLTIFLASQSNIKVHCPEPNRTYEMHELEKQFLREEIEYYYFARTVYQWWRIPDPKPDFREYINRFLERDKKMSGWNDFDFSIENIKKIHERLFGAEFDSNNSNFFKNLVTPVELKTVINKVARSSSNLRNEYILKEMLKYWNNGFSIFIEYGAGHAVMQELVLKDLEK